MQREAKKEKRGLMSRKMMLLRSRTSSSITINGNANGQATPRSVPSAEHSRDSSSDIRSTLASSPTLQDVGNLVPELSEGSDSTTYPEPKPKRLSTSASSFSSEDYNAIPKFLQKYENGDETTDDEFGDSPAQQRLGYTVSIEGGHDARREQQEREEANSAMLSRRAEQILANAKKRLNVMEGNLRGARDLVAPLTTANLKRATSLGSSHVSPASTYSGRGRFVPNGYHYEPPAQQAPQRMLHAQASSPTMGRDFRQGGHNRGFSETELPERPHTAMARSNSAMKNGRIPVRPVDQSWTTALRGSRSHESLGSNPLRRPASRENGLYAKGSPDSNLEPLVEDDGSTNPASQQDSSYVEETHGLGVYRSVSTTDDLRTQMSSLKGKISTLKERAREDSLRRQSMNNLRTPSPLNNAVYNAPEMWYAQSPAYHAPVLDTNAGVGYSPNDSPQSPQRVPTTWEQTSPVKTGSRNAFAEQAAQQSLVPNGRTSDERLDRPQSRRQLHSVVEPASRIQHTLHKRTPSGNVMVQPADLRLVHHRYTHSREMPGSFDSYEVPAMADDAYDDFEDGVSPLAANDSCVLDQDHVASENGSVYEDAEVEQPPVVAHEDRDDAFDYEHFFLHSAMGTYSQDRRASNSSEDSVSSVETARGPTAATDEEFEPTSALYPPPTPETPETLREIERNLHKRTLSSDTVSTMDTFATADEGSASPTPGTGRASRMDWPIPPTDSRPGSGSRPGSKPSSRPSTAVKRTETKRDDDGSDRADSGVGLPRRSNSNHGAKRSGTLTPKSPANSAMLSPPISPMTMVFHDPATVAVNAMLDPNARQLGLKDKALLFGLVESLREVCHKLQDEDEGRRRVLRRRLDDAKRVLNGAFEH